MSGRGGAAAGRRRAELERYEVLNRPVRRDLQALAELAAQVAQVPMATVNLIDDTHQHQIATAGFSGRVCVRDEAMCNVVLDAAGPTIVDDAREDPRFCDNPFVTGVYGNVRFYAAHQLRTPRGVVIGMLCALDTEPRTISGDQQHALAHLADRVVDLLELELRSRELEARTRDLERRSRELTRVVSELERAQAELERSNQQLATFAGRVSHDLKNPLAAVSMSLEMLEDRAADADVDQAETRFMVHRASCAAQRMQAMIDDLLEFARLDGGLTMRETDLGQILADVRDDLAPDLDGVAVVAGDLPVVFGDSVQLRAVLQNLMSNAAKFRTSDRPARIEVTATESSGCWRISVCDNGLGVPDHARDRIFEPFVRAHQHVAGSGIGLATVHTVVRAHGGAVGVHETPGGGASFWFEIPHAPSQGRARLAGCG